MRAILAFAVMAASSAAQSAGALEARVKGRLLAPCCYRETVDHHVSEAADQMRREIHQMFEEGNGERIVDTYKKRYGAKVLAEPEGLTWWLGAGPPLVLLGAGGLLVIRFISRQTRSNLADASDLFGAEG